MLCHFPPAIQQTSPKPVALAIHSSCAPALLANRLPPHRLLCPCPQVTPRLLRHFTMLCVPQPSEASMRHVFSAILGGFMDHYFTAGGGPLRMLTPSWVRLPSQAPVLSPPCVSRDPCLAPAFVACPAPQGFSLVCNRNPRAITPCLSTCSMPDCRGKGTHAQAHGGLECGGVPEDRCRAAAHPCQEPLHLQPARRVQGLPGGWAAPAALPTRMAVPHACAHACACAQLHLMLL